MIMYIKVVDKDAQLTLRAQPGVGNWETNQKQKKQMIYCVFFENNKRNEREQIF